MTRAIFGAGCFWGVEYVFRQVPGVQDVACGYSGGHAENPSYKQVCAGTTGHAEVVEVLFDPALVSFEQLLDVFFESHDPTTLNRQGPDVGTQYRSAIYCVDEEQRLLAEKSKDRWNASKKYPRPIVTEIAEAKPFWRAEEYHQRYFEKHGVQGCHL